MARPYLGEIVLYNLDGNLVPAIIQQIIERYPPYSNDSAYRCRLFVFTPTQMDILQARYGLNAGEWNRSWPTDPTPNDLELMLGVTKEGE